MYYHKKLSNYSISHVWKTKIYTYLISTLKKIGEKKYSTSVSNFDTPKKSKWLIGL